MHRLPIHQQILLIIQTVALLALAIHIWMTGMYRRYAWFFVYLLLALAQTVVLALVPFDSTMYRNAYVITEGMITCSYALVTLELYSIVLKDLTGIAKLSRGVIRIILAIAAALSLLLLGLERTPATPTGYLFAVERPIFSSLVLFLLLINAFLIYYPAALSRNAIVYSIGYALYFLTKATALFILNLGHYWNESLGTVRIFVSTACLIFWFFALNKAGERKTMAIGHWWNPDDEEQVLSRLRSINAGLLRAGRK